MNEVPLTEGILTTAENENQPKPLIESSIQWNPGNTTNHGTDVCNVYAEKWVQVYGLF
jgi:hypothetical protein